MVVFQVVAVFVTGCGSVCSKVLQCLLKVVVVFVTSCGSVSYKVFGYFLPDVAVLLKVVVVFFTSRSVCTSCGSVCYKHFFKLESPTLSAILSEVHAG